MTPRRALLGLVPTVVGIAAGVGWFTFEWAGTTPIDLEGNTGPTLSLVEIVRLELTAVQFVALAAASMLFVGTVAASHGRRGAVPSVSLPIAFLALGFRWGPQVPTALELLSVVLLATVPFAIGFWATLPEHGEASSPSR